MQWDYVVVSRQKNDYKIFLVFIPKKRKQKIVHYYSVHYYTPSHIHAGIYNHRMKVRPRQKKTHYDK